MKGDGLFPPPARSARRLPATDETFFEELFLDLTLRVEWLGQVIDGVPESETSADVLGRLRGYARALKGLRIAIGHVQSHLWSGRFAKLFVLEGPLAAYLSRLYAWCEDISADFERLAIGLRRKEPVWGLLSHHAVNRSYAQFAELATATRERLALWHGEDEAWKTFEANVEDMLAATEWLHLSLARKPGE